MAGNQELSRMASDANFNSGVKVISKKLISFRSQSKSGDKKHKIEFRNSNKLKLNYNAYDKQSTIKIKMNQTQPFNQGMNHTPSNQTGSAVNTGATSITHRAANQNQAMANYKTMAG
jgi:hypothetical protein